MKGADVFFALRLAGAAAVFAAARLLGAWAGAYAFIAPASRCAALLSGSPQPEHGPGGILLRVGGGVVSVDASCSGALFFAVLCAGLFWIFSARLRSAGGVAASAALSIAAAYPLAIAANACRIAACARAYILCGGVLPQKYHAAAHMACSTACFFFFLLVFSILAVKGSDYVKSRFGPA